jgi:predicted nucleic acid-binding protein
VYCFDTDVLSALLGRDPPLHLIRRLARVPAEAQFTTAITLGELLYGAARGGREPLGDRIRLLVAEAAGVLPFDEAAAESYAQVCPRLEREGRPLAEPDLRIAAIALARELTLVTGNVRHFGRVHGLSVENWLDP